MQRAARGHPGLGAMRATPPYRAVPSHDQMSGARQLQLRLNEKEGHDDYVTCRTTNKA